MRVDERLLTWLERLAYAPFPLVEGIMKKLLFSLFAVAALSGAFLVEAVAAFPPNDWRTIPNRIAAPD
jgi:hypothetical protein